MSKVKGKVLLDKIAVLCEEKKEEITKAGIIVPDQVKKDEPLKGKVVLVGDGKIGEEMKVKIGDNILFNQHAGTKVKNEDNINLLILTQSEVTLVL